MRLKMKLEEAMIYVLATSGRGMTTDRIAEEITHKNLYLRADGRPVSSAQVYAAVCRNPAIFVKEGGIILLIM